MDMRQKFARTSKSLKAWGCLRGRRSDPRAREVSHARHRREHSALLDLRSQTPSPTGREKRESGERAGRIKPTHFVYRLTYNLSATQPEDSRSMPPKRGPSRRRRKPPRRRPLQRRRSPPRPRRKRPGTSVSAARFSPLAFRCFHFLFFSKSGHTF